MKYFMKYLSIFQVFFIYFKLLNNSVITAQVFFFVFIGIEIFQKTKQVEIFQMKYFKLTSLSVSINYLLGFCTAYFE